MLSLDSGVIILVNGLVKTHAKAKPCFSVPLLRNSVSTMAFFHASSVKSPKKLKSATTVLRESFSCQWQQRVLVQHPQKHMGNSKDSTFEY